MLSDSLLLCQYILYQLIFFHMQIIHILAQYSYIYRYVLARFNKRFAKEYEKEPAEIPEEWEKITEAEALSSLRKGFLSEQYEL